MARLSTGTVTSRAGTPRPIIMLNMLLPKTVPIAKLLRPLLAEVNTVKNSGEVVPNANKIPANMADKEKITESSTVQYTIIRHPIANPKRPNNRPKTFLDKLNVVRLILNLSSFWFSFSFFSCINRK